MSTEPETFVQIGDRQMPANLQPPQHDLQGAFVASGKRIVVDMDLARPIARDMVRAARAKAFEANDAATMRAVQSEDKAALAACKARGDALRNATKDSRIDAAATPDALLAAVEAITGEFA